MLVWVAPAGVLRRRDVVRDVVRAGVDWVQLRDRDAEDGELLEAADTVKEATPGARLVVNRRADVALAADADGVHLGFDALDAATARGLLGPDAWIGISAHTPAEVVGAKGASYAHLAPIHPPLSKRSERPALGLDPLREASVAGFPVIAQGGFTAKNARAAIDAGASGIAVTGSITNADDPARATRALRAALDA